MLNAEFRESAENFLSLEQRGTRVNKHIDGSISNIATVNNVTLSLHINYSFE